jgi:hypothetical protein
MPFQVLFEFITDFEIALNTDANNFNKLNKFFDDELIRLKRTQKTITNQIENLDLQNRHTVINPDEFIPGNFWDEPIKRIEELLEKLKSFQDQQITREIGIDIQKQVLEIFDNKIGECFSKVELEKIYSEGFKRYEAKIPPGYKDINKIDPETKIDLFKLFEDKKIISKYGDLIIWKEIIKKAKNDNLEYLLLITDDKKEDWFFTDGNSITSPRTELLNEIYYEVPTLKAFHATTSRLFLRYIKDILKIDVDESSIKDSGLSFFDPINNRFIENTSFVSELIEQAIQSVSPELVLLPIETEKKYPMTLMAYPNLGTTPFFSRHSEKFSAVLRSIFRFFYSISLGKGIYYKFDRVITGYYIFEFSTNYQKDLIPIDTEMIELEVKTLYPINLGFSASKSEKQTPYEFHINHLTITLTFFAGEFYEKR